MGSDGNNEAIRQRSSMKDKSKEIELHPDPWARFERVDAVAKDKKRLVKFRRSKRTVLPPLGHLPVLSKVLWQSSQADEQSGPDRNGVGGAKGRGQRERAPSARTDLGGRSV
jgi:hypothetical protein